MYTENLADFGARERAMVCELLKHELPSNFADDGVKIGFNTDSGLVFLVNADYQCAMVNPGTEKLEIYHTLPWSTYEGFISEFFNDCNPADLNAEDVEYIVEQYKQEDCTFDVPDCWKPYL